MRPIAPVGFAEFYAVPGFDCLQEKLVQALALIFGIDVSQQPPRNEQFHKTVQIRMLRDQGPIEPTGLIVLAVGVVVAQLGPAHFVAHQDHGHTQ